MVSKWQDYGFERCLLGVFIAATLWDPAEALTINLDFLAPGESFSVARTEAVAAPRTVGDGAFEQVVRDAADTWSSLIGDPGTLNVAVGWSPLASVGAAARAWQFRTRSYSGSGKVSDIQFSSDLTWFLDEDPFEHGEYRTLTVAQQDLGGGSMTTGIEYTGALGPAAFGRDLFSTALHELGHLVGFTQFSAARIEDPVAITAGRFDGARVDVSSDGAHIEGLTSALMYVPRPNAVRRTVSQVDLAVAAELSGFTDIDWGGAAGPAPAPIPGPASIAGLAGALVLLGSLRRRRIGAGRARTSRG